MSSVKFPLDTTFYILMWTSVHSGLTHDRREDSKRRSDPFRIAGLSESALVMLVEVPDIPSYFIVTAATCRAVQFPDEETAIIAFQLGCIP